LTSPISDSLSGTTSCIELRSLSTANEELEEESPEAVLLFDAPVVERPVAPVAPVPVAPDELLALDDALVVPLPETTSPTWPASETIVPLSGAYSLVSWTACSSLLTVSWSLLTAALAEARLASRVAALIVAFGVEEPEPASLLLRSRSPVVSPLGAALDGAVVVRFPALGVVVALGAVELGVVALCVVVPLGAVALGAVPVGVALAGVVVASVGVVPAAVLAPPGTE
jgi:hypothetical protein